MIIVTTTDIKDKSYIIVFHLQTGSLAFKRACHICQVILGFRYLRARDWRDRKLKSKFECSFDPNSTWSKTTDAYII